jgi:hypothetical protein
MIQSAFNNEGSAGDAIVASGAGWIGRRMNVAVQSGSCVISVRDGARLKFEN